MLENKPKTVEDSLREKLEAIFKVKKISFNEPGESREQDCLFISIDDSRPKISDNKCRYRISGRCLIYGRNDKVKIGFFSKAISQADADLTKDFFFHDFESNTKTYGEIVQRGFSFVYFFTEQYDPDTGDLTSLTTEVIEL